MSKYSFMCDYSEGAHPSLLDLMAQTNDDQEIGYGEDSLCLKAAALIKEMVGNPQAAIHFVSGGTQANLLVLSSMLRPYEAVIGANTAHINVHETGAVEATGHKVLVANTPDGKLTPALIQGLVDLHTDEHMVKPRVVYISNSTEVGTVYRKNELEDIARVCRENSLYLYLDGARLGSALCSKESDLTLPDLGRLVDVFYIGGTKNGALLGEAIVINTPELQRNFRFHLKQRGALLAKGRLLGVQFLGLFSDGLYFRLATHANAMAERLSEGIREQGFTFVAPSTTNQIFPIFPDTLVQELLKRYDFYAWARVDAEHTAVRLVTSWATKQDMVDEFLCDLKELVQPQLIGTV